MKVRSPRALRQLKKWRSYVLVVIAAYVLTSALGALLGPLRGNLDNLVFDQYQRWKPRPYDFSQPVRIVDIDDESIHLIGRWPWSRRTMAEMVEALVKAKVAAIGFDYLFSEKDQAAGDVAKCARGGASADAASRCQERADGDAALAQAIQGRPSSSAYISRRPTTDPKRASRPRPDFLSSATRRRPRRLLQRRARADPRTGGHRDGLGFLNWLPDNDRVVRRVPFCSRQRPDSAEPDARDARVAQGRRAIS